MWPFKKKEKRERKGIPEISELPELPPFPKAFEESPKPEPKIKDELPPLPSFSPSPKYIIKEPPKIKVELPKPKPRTRELEEIKERVYKPIVKEITPEIKTEPIFVRIDRYQQALAQFQEIKKRISEIDNLLRDIREIRSREEAELQQWEQEIQDAKSKLNSIDKTIFKKLEE